MTTKQTILIAAATYFTLEFSVWALGWLAWLILWVVFGYLVFHCVLEFLDDEFDGDYKFMVLSSVFWPILVLIVVLQEADERGFWNFKIRNPFVWTKKEVDSPEETK